MENRDLLLNCSDKELQKYVELEFFKGSGNGGQKRNKCSTAVRVRLKSDSDISAYDCAERSQHRNRHNALNKLRREIAMRFRVDEINAPEHFDCSMENPGYYLWMARIVDVIARFGNFPESAAFLNVSRSALERKIRRDAQLWQYISKIIENKLEK